MRNSVVLPAPFGPMTPTMPPRGSLKSRFVEQQPVAERLADAVGLDDHVAEARAGRDDDLERSRAARFGLLGEQLLVAAEARLALGLARLAATCRTHSSSRSSVLLRAPTACFSSTSRRFCLLLEPATSSCPRTGCPRRGRARGSTGDVVEEVAIVGDGDDGARELLAGSARATRPTRRRGGWSARRAAACRASGAAGGRARRGGARRRRAWSRRRRAGGQRSASIAISSLRSSSQALAASIWSCSLPCSSSSLFISSSSIGSANFALTSSKRRAASRVSATPSSTLPRTVLVGSSCGSCGR